MRSGGEVVEAEQLLDVAAAKRLDHRIRLMAGTLRDNLHKIESLVEEAKRGQIHHALGFASWTAYLVDALGGRLDLGTDGRRAVVELMAGHGVSQRTIAQAVGVSQATIGRDVQVNRNGSPEEVERRPQVNGALQPTVTGLDGKTYSQSRPARKPPRSSILRDAAGISRDMRRVFNRLEMLLGDERYGHNQDSIRCEFESHLEADIELLQRLRATAGEA
jgi:hypothetical protein